MHVDELRDEMRALSPPGGERFSWASRRAEIRERFLADPSRFLEWSVSAECLFAGRTRHTERLYELLKQRDLPVAVDPGACGAALDLDGNSGQYVQQSYYFHLWSKHSKTPIDNVTSIVEFGGGYGSSVVVARQLGFSGRYTIVDFPEMHVLQKYYLYRCGRGANVRYASARDAGDADLLIAVCSLSEAPLDARDTFLENWRAPAALIVYQPNFYGYENTDYFMELPLRAPLRTWPSHWYGGRLPFAPYHHVLAAW